MAALRRKKRTKSNRKRSRARGSARRRRWPRIVALIALMLTLIAAGAVAWWLVPPAGLDPWRTGAPPEIWAVYQAQLDAWQAAGREPRIRYDYRPLGDIPIDVQLAVLAGEDINFFGHEGIDFTALREAVDEWRGGERLRGASTISQQLAKNLFLSNERSWLRKLREARLTWHLERELGKRRILELYLNVIEFGEGILGVEAAAREYYGRGIEGISADEAAGLAATIPAPHTSNPATATRAWQNRKAAIVPRVEQAGWLRDILLRQRDATGTIP